MIYLITGGERSGKSSFAQQLALSLSSTPTYLATARKWDSSFEKRIERHQVERGAQWKNLEVEKEIGSCTLDGEVVVIDCVTLWLTNYFTDSDGDVNLSLSLAKAEFEKISAQNATLIFVTNEIGMGLHATTPLGRKFVELQGWMNQYIASNANCVKFMVSGIPLTIKE